VNQVGLVEAVLILNFLKGFVLVQIMLSTETHERIGLGKLVKIDKSGRKLNYWCEGDPK
jgi:hypothetical protein